MIIQLADMINCILQAILFVFTINHCIGNQYKKSKKGLIIATIITWISLQGITMLLGNTSLSVILHHMALMFILYFVFDKEVVGVTIAFGISYGAVIINVLICSNIFGFVKAIIPEQWFNIGFVVCAYLPQYIMTIYFLQNLDKINRLYKTIRAKNLSVIALTLATVILDFMTSFDILIHDRDNPMFKSTLFILVGFFLLVITVYFAGLEKKMREIAMLNNALDEKISELKKVKHDYGAQISYLYGLHLMNRHERIGELLKDIINGHDSIAEAVQVANNSDSVISIITNGIVHKGINVVVDEQADLSEIAISEIELQRVISNIVNNAITAMEYKGIITVRTYYNFGNIIINIQNNGPKIQEHIIEKIFNPGFSTKLDKNKDHGFGLAIVKELIEKHRGTIDVNSNEELTEFVIKLPASV